MNLLQAIDVINALVLTPDDQLPSEDDWPIIEEAVATLQAAIVSKNHEGYTKKILIDMIGTTQMVLALAKAGGYEAIASVLADENMSVIAWLDEIVV